MTQLIFGTRQIGGPPSYKSFSEEKSGELLQYAYNKGIHIFDTAPIYGNGQSEKLLGRYLGDVRKNIKIITKFGFQFDKSGNTYFDFTAKGIQEQLQMSLDRLKTDYIDNYLLHIPDKSINIAEVIETLNILKNRKLIRSYGVCNCYSNQLKSFLNHPFSEIEFIQDFYNIIERKAEKLIFPYIKENHKFMAYGPLYRGLLTDMSIKKLLEKDEGAINRLMKNDDLPLLIKKRKIFEEVAKRKGISVEKIAINFLRSQKNVSYVLFGTTNKKHLDMLNFLI